MYRIFCILFNCFEKISYLDGRMTLPQLLTLIDKYDILYDAAMRYAGQIGLNIGGNSSSGSGTGKRRGTHYSANAPHSLLDDELHKRIRELNGLG